MAKVKKENIGAAVYRIINEPVNNLGYDIWDVDYHKEGSEYDLEVIIENKDRSKAIGLDDCEKVSRLISPMLDESDPIEENYYLEVSSCGIERVLKKDEHFAYCTNWFVTVYLFAQFEGKKQIVGKLVGYSDGNLTVESEGKTVLIEKGKYSKVVATQEEI